MVGAIQGCFRGHSGGQGSGRGSVAEEVMVYVEVGFVTYGDRWEENLAIGEEVKGVDDRSIAGILEGNDAEYCGGGLHGFEDVFQRRSVRKVECWSMEPADVTLN